LIQKEQKCFGALGVLFIHLQLVKGITVIVCCRGKFDDDTPT
jgi:hypothetical protein